MKTEEKVLTYFFLIVVILMICFTFELNRPGSKMVPLLVGFITLALLVLLSIMTISPKFDSWYKQLEGKSKSLTEIGGRPDESENDSDQKKIRKKELNIVGWLIFLTALTYILGFIVAIPLFLFLFLKLSAKESWLLSITMPAVVLAVVFFIFSHVLQIPLHEGIIFV
jgi:hypothetical protein